MTNFEKYKEQLLSFDYVEGNTPAKKSGKLMRCADTIVPKLHKTRLTLKTELLFVIKI